MASSGAATGGGGGGGKADPGAPRTLRVNGRDVAITARPGLDLDVALAAPTFKDWVDGFSPDLDLRAIYFQDLDMFGPRVGFLKFKTEVHYGGKQIPGVVFLRGGAVAVLVVLVCEGTEYALLTVQPRVPVGSSGWKEIPAGMLDGDGNFAGVAAKEMKEETGLEIRETDMIDMTGVVYDGARATKDRIRGMYPSVGACDEFLRIFLHRSEITRAKMDEMKAKVYGAESEGEVITIDFVPLAELHLVSPDSKTLSALFLYNLLKSRGSL